MPPAELAENTAVGHKNATHFLTEELHMAEMGEKLVEPVEMPVERD